MKSIGIIALSLLILFALSPIESRDIPPLAENAFDVAELFAAEESMEAGDVVVLAYTKYDYSNAASALDLEERELKEIMEKEGASDPLEIAEELKNQITGNAISEIGLETDLTNILEPESNATAFAAGNNSASGESTASIEQEAVQVSEEQNNETKTEKIRKKSDEKNGKIDAAREDKLLASKAAVVALTNVQNDANIVGVVSTKPAFTMGFGSELKNASSVPVALVGRVPVKASLENGEIKVGDPLTSSARKGYAAKSINSGRIIGYAMEPYRQESKNDKILVFVQPGWYNAPVETAQARQPALPAASMESLGYSKVNGSVIIRLG